MTDELYIPRNLIVLIRERLGGSNPEYKQMSRVAHNKSKAAIIGGQIKARGKTPTFRMLGRILGVSPSTVKRWFEPGEFEIEMDYWSGWFDKTGELIPFERRQKQPLREKDTAQR